MVKELGLSSREIRKQFEKAKLEVSRQLYEELASKFAKTKYHRTP